MIFDLGTREVSSLIELESSSGDVLYISGMSWTPDGKYLAFSSNHDGRSDIYVVTRDGRSWVNFTEEMEGDFANPVWKP